MGMLALGFNPEKAKGKRGIFDSILPAITSGAATLLLTRKAAPVGWVRRKG